MAELDFFMMVAVLVLTPLFSWLLRFIAKRSYTLFQKQTKARGLQTQLIEESLTQESLIQSLTLSEAAHENVGNTIESEVTVGEANP